MLTLYSGMLLTDIVEVLHILITLLQQPVCKDISLSLESRAVTITTLAKDRIQHRSNVSNSPRDEYEQTEEKIYFTQGPENVVIKVTLVNYSDKILPYIRKYWQSLSLAILSIILCD